MLASGACRALRLVRSATRSIATSGKRSDSAVTAAPAASEALKQKEVQKDIINEDNWVSYGFSETNKKDDENYYNATFLVTVTIVMVLGGAVFAYMPDVTLRDWASREAFLELRRREAAGLPPIDRNFIDPANIVLPSDEELGDTEIII